MNIKRFLEFFLIPVGFRRTVPTSRAGFYRRRVERTISLLVFAYLGLQIFPQVLFAHHLSENGITLYARNPLPPEAATCLQRATELLQQQTELAAPGRRERIFVCDSPWLFRLFSPMSAQSFASSVPITDHIFIAAADYANDLAHSSAPSYNRRALSAVVAHEITHGLIRHRLGLVRGVSLPAWIAEGYCDYVARESSFPEEKGKELLAAGQSDPSHSFRYFEYRQMVRYLMDDRHLSFAQLVARRNEFPAVEAETRQLFSANQPPLKRP